MESLGKYQILEKIGAGGFGDVYKGYDPFIKRHVAVKTCASEDREIRHRFFQEAEIAGNLHHRNITTVYDFGIQDGLPYLIQEYLSGEDLHRKIKRRDFIPFPEKLYYLLQIARGLAYAHSQGVIHRDIKPSNIRILDDGTSKIMDFGIARLAQRESTLTKTGMTIGTAAYLAPEQIRGESISVQTDIFSFGVLAYELLTGQRPFQGEQISAIMYSVLNSDPVPIRSLWPAAPQNIIAVVNRCLLKQAGQRYVDGQDLTEALEKVQESGRSDRLVGGDESTQPFVAQNTAPMAQATESLARPGAPQHPAARPSRGAQSPAAQSPAAQSPAAQSPAAQSPAAQSPAAQSPAAQSPAAQSPAARSPQITEATRMASIAGQTMQTSATAHRQGAPTLDEIEFAGGPDQAAEPEIASATSALDPIYTGRHKKSNSLQTIALITFLAAIAGFGGWWFGARQSAAPEFAQTVDVTSPTAAVDPEPEAQEPNALANSAQNTNTPADPAPVPPPEAAPETQTAAEPAIEETPPPPPPPEPAKITFLQPSWAPDITVSFNGVTSSLPVVREVKAGSYEAIFTLDRPNYKDRRTKRFRVEAGQDLKVSSNIPQPGQLTVRPGIRKPQGVVRINSEEIGENVSERVLAPGTYLIEIKPKSEGRGSAQITNIEIVSGQRTTLTYDLTAASLNDAITERKISLEAAQE